MPSSNIVRDCRTLIQNKLLDVVPTKWLPQAAFGVEAFTLRPFQSAGSNARAVVGNRNTASSKMFRLLSNVKLAEHLGSVFDCLCLVRPSSYLNVDHSDLDGLTALVGAVQTRNGRAIPAMVETTYAHHIPAHSKKSRWQKLRHAMVVARKTQSFTGHTIDTSEPGRPAWLLATPGLRPRLRQRIHGDSLGSREGATFYIRLKAGRFVELDDGETVTRLPVKELKENDAAIRLYGLTLRVIRSPKSRRSPEPWYILTNDLSSSRNKVVKVYYHRFEIEETFKDAKHIFELHRLSFMRPNSLKVVLWLIFLGIAVLYVVTKPVRQVVRATHPRKQCSWVRLAYEQFQRELTTQRGLTGLTPRY